jgi:hypothetical protein
VGNGNIQINDMTSWVEPTMDHGDFDFKTSWFKKMHTIEWFLIQVEL